MNIRQTTAKLQSGGGRCKLREIYVPVTIISEKRRLHWNKDTYVIPEYTFGFECREENIKLSYEHTECVWLTYDEANQKLEWDSNRTALYELNCRLLETNRSE